MCELQRETVTRVVVQEFAVALDRSGEVAFQPGTRCGEVAPFAIVGAAAEALARLDARAHHRQHRVIAEENDQAGAHGVRHHEIGILGDCLVQHCERIDEVTLNELDRLLVARE